MLLGGRAADLLGRRRVLVAGISLIGISSLDRRACREPGVLIGARLAQGLGAAMTLPAALSILTTTFKEGQDRNTALGVWGAIGGLASAAGVLLGGLLTEGPGWRWVMFVNPVAAVLVLVAIFRLIRSRPRPSAASRTSTSSGAMLATGGMLLLVYALVKAPTVGWGTCPDDRRARRRAGAAVGVRRSTSAATQPARAAVDLPHQRARATPT